VVDLENFVEETSSCPECHEESLEDLEEEDQTDDEADDQQFVSEPTGGGGTGASAGAGTVDNTRESSSVFDDSPAHPA
jgi:hypothetical protein